MNEIKDLQKLKDGDHDAWRSAFPILYGVARSAAKGSARSLPEASVEDIALQAIEDTMRAIERIERVAHLKAYVATAAVNGARSLLRRELAQKRGAGQTDSLDELAVDPPEEQTFLDNPVIALERIHLIEQLSFCLSELSPNHRKVIELRFLNELSYEEIGVELNLSVSTVGVNLSRALKELQKNIENRPKLLKEMQSFLRL